MLRIFPARYLRSGFNAARRDSPATGYPTRPERVSGQFREIRMRRCASVDWGCAAHDPHIGLGAQFEALRAASI